GNEKKIEGCGCAFGSGFELAGQPALERGMIPEVILMAAESEPLAGGDVWLQIVDVKGFRRVQAMLADGVVVDFRLGLDGTGFERQHRTLEKGKLRVGLEYPRAVDGVRVREKNQPVSFGGELADAIPHGLVRSEYVPPCVAELVRCGIRAYCLDGPVDV